MDQLVTTVSPRVSHVSCLCAGSTCIGTFHGSCDSDTCVYIEPYASHTGHATFSPAGCSTGWSSCRGVGSMIACDCCSMWYTSGSRNSTQSPPLYTVDKIGINIIIII